MDFSEPPEHEMLREAVGDIAAKFGHEYFAERARTGGKANELWDAVGDAGFLGVHLPEEYGGGGGGHQRARDRVRGARGARVPAPARSSCRPRSAPS